MRGASKLLPSLFLCLIGAALAQSIDFAATLTPWPPPGWPEGAAGEVRVTTLGEGNSFIDLASFPVEDTGRVHITLEPGAPRALGDAPPFDLNSLAVCDTVLPTVSPGDVHTTLALLFIYAKGEPWGVIESISQRSTGLLSTEATQFLGVLYADQAAVVVGGGTCELEEGPAEVRFELELQEGASLLIGMVEGGVSGTTISLVTEPLLSAPLQVSARTAEELVSAFEF